MTVSLRDQLLGLGFAAPVKPEKPAAKSRPSDPRNSGRPAVAGKDRHAPASRKPDAASRRDRPAQAARTKPAASSAEMDLAKAYAIRAQREKQERIEAEQRKQEDARRKREAKARVGELLKDRSLNDAAAEIARHFEYGNKIRRIYVTADQLKALNAGELAVVQLDGRYLLVTLEIACAVEALLPSLVALRIDPNAPPADDPYSDPQYQVPDDLIW